MFSVFNDLSRELTKKYSREITDPSHNKTNKETANLMQRNKHLFSNKDSSKDNGEAIRHNWAIDIPK
jgi:predicted house-cleaning noncanonical NTP pyrophosphatase (MazG superfamily)